MRLLTLLLLLFTVTCQAQGWITTSDKRVLHLRTEAEGDAMLDIRCSNTYKILLGASYLTADLDDMEFINTIIIDGTRYPNYLDPDTPPESKAAFIEFWEALRNAKTLVVVVDGIPRNVTTKNIYSTLPDSNNEPFTCRPVTTQGILIN